MQVQALTAILAQRRRAKVHECAEICVILPKNRRWRLRYGSLAVLAPNGAQDDLSQPVLGIHPSTQGSLEDAGVLVVAQRDDMEQGGMPLRLPEGIHLRGIVIRWRRPLIHRAR